MSGKKVTSNLAEYKNGQLTCIVCRVPVKNELYWTGHVNGRQHRDNINLLKRKAGDSSDGGQRQQEAQEPLSKKSRTGVDDGHVFAKPKPVTSTSHPVPEDVQDRIIFKSSKNAVSSASKQAEVTKKNLAVLRQFDEEEPVDDEEFMDHEVSQSTSQNNNSVNPAIVNKAQSKEDIPEGFFDDPKEDAKARGKEFVDPEEAEWNKFLKEIASEEIQSESLLVVDEEESRKERELDEIEEQMGHWQRVIDLEKKKESRVKKMETETVQSDSSGDEGDFNEELDWRVKKF